MNYLRNRHNIVYHIRKKHVFYPFIPTNTTYVVKEKHGASGPPTTMYSKMPICPNNMYYAPSLPLKQYSSVSGPETHKDR